MTKDKSPAVSRIKTCSNLLLLSAVFFSLPGYAKDTTSAWHFDSGEDHCMLSTAVNSYNFKNYVSASAALFLYYVNQPVVTDNCEEMIEQNVVSAIIFSGGANKIQTGTHAQLQSKNLLNEQAPVLQFNPACTSRHAYSLDYRVTDLLLTDLLAGENIWLTTYLEKYGSMVGLVRTDGFEAAYEKLVACIDRLNE